MRKSLSGFTLLEICIAIAIFAIGALTAMSILVPAVRWGADAKNDFTAAEAALSAVECKQSGGGLTNLDVKYSPVKITISDSSVTVNRRVIDPFNNDETYTGTTGGELFRMNVITTY